MSGFENESINRLRRDMWLPRIRSEIGSAPRSWLLHFKVSPAAMLAFTTEADGIARVSGLPWTDVSPKKRSAYMHRVISRQVALYVKRLRKAMSSELRYLVVDCSLVGAPPAFVALFHEYPADDANPDLLVRQWPHGHLEPRLITDRADFEALSLANWTAFDVNRRTKASQTYGGGFDQVGEAGPPETGTLL
jgi:hypothetical protein